MPELTAERAAAAHAAERRITDWARHGVGFTGTRHGLGDAQAATVEALLAWYRPEVDSPLTDWFRHGDCVGADAQAAAIARRLGYAIAAYPPADDILRAFTVADWSHRPESYLLRNAAIVAASAALLACPAEAAETPRARGGTWWTVRYARRQGVPLVIVWPDGTATAETPPAAAHHLPPNLDYAS